MRVEYLMKGVDVSQSQVSKAEAAQQRSYETRSFVRTVKAATRRRYTPEEKIRIVLEDFCREVTMNDLCRQEGIKPHSYYAWTKEFMKAGKEYHRKTTGSNQMSSTDASYFRVMGWSCNYLVTVMDDYSHFILSHKLQRDMTSDSFIGVV